jgi:hypothetical protein
LARAMLSGEGSADLLPLISHPNSLRAKPAPSPGSSGRYSHFSTAVKWRKAQASDRFSALTLPRILSVLSSKLTF